MTAQRRQIPRDWPFNQSSGKFRGLSRRSNRLLYWFGMRPKEWFHTLLSLPTTVFMLFFVMTYSGSVILFACIYVAVDSPGDCDLSFNDTDDSRLTFREAFAFSVETSATIGYGLPSDRANEAFFETCSSLALTVHAQMVFYTTLEAVLVSLLFLRLSRGTTKAAQILFSDQATIRCVDGNFEFSFRVCEMSFFTFHPVLSPDVCVYAIQRPTPPATGVRCRAASNAPPPPLPGFGVPRHGAPPTTASSNLERHAYGSDSIEVKPMRTTSTSERFGGRLFLPLPEVITHTIDELSPLFPPSDAAGMRDTGGVLDLRCPSRRFTLGAVKSRRMRSPSSAASTCASSDVRVSAATATDADKGGACGHQEGSGCGAVKRSASETYGAAGSAAAARTIQAYARGKRARSSGSLCQRAASSLPSPPPSPPSGRSSAAAAGNFEDEDEELAKLLRQRSRIAAHLLGSGVEVLVALEATDPITGSAFQARHSYTVEDIVWDHDFCPAVARRADGKLRVDWEAFHALVPVPINVRSPPT